MKLSLIKPLSAMLASIVMCVIFSLSHPTKATSSFITNQCDSSETELFSNNFRAHN